MLREMLLGASAGALGTVALNVTTYLDMFLRARPASTVPARTAGHLAEKAKIDLAPGQHEGEDTLQNRTQGLGALLGYVTGLGVGAAYGLLRSGLSVSKPIASLLLGAAAMAGSDVPATALGVTNPKQWGAKSWVSDIVPHMAYGTVTAMAYDALSTSDGPRHIDAPTLSAPQS
ncbi:MAG: hypothetical protein M3O70_20345 [Actinomycetota bacterium]|nr:hypothetical protein [Actinomycetota bacterium]